MDNNSDNRYFRSKAAADKRTVKFKENTQIAYELSVESAGTSDSAPYIFLADNDDCGLTSSAKIQVGTYKVGHLAIRRGTFEFNTLDVGSGSGTSGNVLVLGGAGHKVSLNSTGNTQVNKDTFKVSANASFSCNDLKVGPNGGATIDIDGGCVTVRAWTRFEKSNSSKTINLINGGALETYYINSQGASGAQRLFFDGGTLKKTTKSDYSLIHENIDVKVGAKGGTVDLNSYDATIEANFSDDDASTPGRMKFCGGGTLTLGGSIGYTGGTTIEAGTTINVASLAQKDGLLGRGVNTLKVIPASGEHTLITITGDGVFSDTDLLKVSLAPGSAGTATFSISNDRKSLMVSSAYIGGAINQDTPTLVFPGATLADLAMHTLRARFNGSSIDDDGVEATFFNRVETFEDDILSKVTYQLQVIDKKHIKASKVEFTADARGVYAKLAEGNWRNYSDTFSDFGKEPLELNSGSGGYIPYDLRLVKPVNAISVNFNHTDGNLDTASSVRYGGGDFAVPYSSWNNMSVKKGSSATFGGVTFTQTETSGQYKCVDLNKSKDLRYGYLDDGGGTVVIDVTDIPYEFYRIVTYHATDNADVQFGYVKINDTRYMGVTDATVKGNSSWGASGARNKAKGLREGVNYLVSDVMSGSSAKITGHKASSARGCIAAVQVVEYALSTYTATVDDGGAKVLSELSWDNSLPALLTAKDRVVLNVNEDTTLDIDIPVDVFGITFNVAEGKTLTLSGQNILSQSITAKGAGKTVVASASQLAGTVKGDGTIVYDGVRPTTTGTDIIFTNPLWTGTLVIKGFNKDNSATGVNRKLFANLWGNVNSKIKWNGVSGYFEGCTSTAGWILEDLEADGVIYPALTKNDGSSSKLTTAPSIEGTGTFADASEPTERFKFENADNFTGTIRITTSTAEKGMNVQFGASGVAVVPGAIHILSQAAVTLSAGKTWTAVGGLV